ncbi:MULTISPECIES: LuxR family transcriptional regulator [Paracoccus]|uniref:helix-turn-helix transcriptional regulator n=1 Tax=Paracoccus TaxID=265 RepID=UPI001F051B95|nr:MULTISPECIES: LuxR family transcriptional regulator [Paracoccus]
MACFRIHYDPLLRYTRTQTSPLVWTPKVIAGMGAPAYTEMISTIGIKGGATIPLPAAEGKFSAITFLAFRPGILPPDQVGALSKVIGYTALSRLDHLGKLSFRKTATSGRLDSLSGKQRHILHWVASGKTNLEIAIILNIPQKQVGYHLSKILQKLGVTTRIQAAAIYAAR